LGITRRVHNFEIASLKAARLDYQNLRLCELGNQYFVDPGEEVHLAKRVYSSWGVDHVSIDLNGENGSLVIDLDKPVPSTLVGRFDVVTNYGTLEHVNNQFQAFKNVHDMCRVGGVMIHTLTPLGHWPGHGRYYYSQEFVIQLAKGCDYAIISLAQRNCYADRSCGSDKELIFAAYLKSCDSYFSQEQFCRIPVVDTGDLSQTGNYTKRNTPNPDPLSALLELYETREDLHSAYPEVHDGDYLRIIQWANYVIENRIDAYHQLQYHESWYRNRLKTQKSFQVS
jgi:hypothetical protein